MPLSAQPPVSTAPQEASTRRHVLEIQAFLGSVLQEYIEEAAQELGPQPSRQEFERYQRDRLPARERERIRAYLTVHPEAYPHRLGGQVPARASAITNTSAIAAERAAIWADLEKRLRQLEAVSPVRGDSLQAAIRGVEPLFAAAHFRDRAKPGMATVRRFVELVGQAVANLNHAVGLEEDPERLVRQGVLQAGFPVLSAFRRGLTSFAARELVSVWRRTTETFTERPIPIELPQSAEQPLPVDRLLISEIRTDLELLPTYQAVVLQVCADEDGERVARRALEKLMTVLDLTARECARMIGASPASVKAWQAGTASPPKKTAAHLTQAEAALDRLLTMFRPERLPLVIRRHAPAFGGRPALDLILEGRITEVVDHYSLSLRYHP